MWFREAAVFGRGGGCVICVRVMSLYEEGQHREVDASQSMFNWKARAAINKNADVMVVFRDRRDFTDATYYNIEPISE